MPRLNSCYQKQKNFESEEASNTSVSDVSLSDCLSLQMDLAEKYIVLGQKQSAKFALAIVSELWKVEKPEWAKERYKTAAKKLSGIW